MDMKQINKKLLVEKYFLGTLSMEEEQEFEELFLASPELLDQLETAEILQQGMKDLDAVERSGKAPVTELGKTSVFRSPRYAMAATVFLAVSVALTGYMYQQNRQLSGEMLTGAGDSAQIVPLYTVRSGDSDTFNAFSLEAGTGQLVLMVDPGMETFSHYRASVLSLASEQTTAPVLQLEGLQPGYEDMLALSVPASSLAAGEYEVIVEGSRAGANSRDYEPVNRVTFRIH